MELEIRTARADDQGPIAELMYSSGPDIYDYLHGPKALDFLRHEFAKGRGFAGYPHVTVALLEGEVVATGCFYDRSVYAERSKEALANMLSFYGVLGAVRPLLHARHVGSVMRRPKPGELYLSNFGVAPHLRSRGIGSRLLEHKLGEARGLGYRLLGLDVSTANPRGEALYVRQGFMPMKDKVFSDPRAKVAPARKMERTL